jgi:hypothetical protein
MITVVVRLHYHLFVYFLYIFTPSPPTLPCYQSVLHSRKPFSGSPWEPQKWDRTENAGEKS